MRLWPLVVVAALSLGPACTRSDAPSGGSAGPATTLPADAVVVKISYGSEKKGWLTDSIDAFHATNPRSSTGALIRVVAVAEGSTESMESILAGRNDAAVWSPASSLLVDVLNDRWTEAQAAWGPTNPSSPTRPRWSFRPL